MKDFRNLKIWEKGHRLALLVYEVTKAFPREEIYGLTSQMRRASTSIPANVAEGCGRSGDAELNRFLRVAMGSASELEYHVILAKDLRFLDESAFQRISTEVEELKKMLASFIGKIGHSQMRQAVAVRQKTQRARADR